MLLAEGSKRDIVRFSSFIEKDADNDCWIWQGNSTDGYGLFWFNGKPERAHRVAYRFFVGRVPSTRYVLHKCDNRLCVNPEHLFLGTQSDNMLDMYAKGRRNFPTGEDNWNSKLTAEQVSRIKELYSRGGSDAVIARLFGVHRITIFDITHGNTWKNVS